MPARYFISATGTGVGKTLVAAILCELLQADYWKPVQTGTPSDSVGVRNWLGDHLTVHPPAYSFEDSLAPHEAAMQAGVRINLADIIFPLHRRPLIIEGVGGLLVPLNERDLLIDWIAGVGVSVIYVVDLYLGAINHALLSAAALELRSIPVAGVVFNRGPWVAGRAAILEHSGHRCLFDLPDLGVLSAKRIQCFAKSLDKQQIL